MDGHKCIPDELIHYSGCLVFTFLWCRAIRICSRRRLVQFVDVELLQTIPVTALNNTHAAETLQISQLMLASSILLVSTYLENIDKYDFVGIGEIDLVPRTDDAGDLLNERVAIKRVVAAYGRSDGILPNMSA